MGTEGFIYLLAESGDDTMFKIGSTRSSNINKRIKSLQTGNGNEIRLIQSYKTNNVFKLELMLHNYFKDKRISGEWFILDKEDVVSFSDICKKYQNIINSLAANPFF